jgi:UDP-glucose 4-epimerase
MYVVTGASGFLAGFVARALARRGESVLAVSRRPASVAGVQTQQVRAYGDLIPSRGSTLIHLAEPNSIPPVEEHAGEHEAQMSDALAALLAKGWAHSVYASSAAVYGDRAMTMRSIGDAVSPSTAYARAKLDCEALIGKADGSVARLSNVYGPGMAANSVISEILDQIPGERDIRIRAASPVRDYMWVEDAAEGIAELATRGSQGVFNFGTGRGTSVGELCRTILRLAGENRAIAESAPRGSPSHLVLDIADTTARLGWAPKMSIESGLQKLMASR